MSVKLENNQLEVEISCNGAELTSLHSKLNNIEYLWYGDADFWNRHAPILFPIVGRLIDNEYFIDDIKYIMNQHGFARDMVFNVTKASKEMVNFELHSNEETLKLYPFNFKLNVEYRLNSGNLEISYTVKNSDSKEMFFSIGAHPGFNCPLHRDESMEDYFFEFDQPETSSVSVLSKEGYITNQEKPLLNENNIIPLSKSLFKNDALIFKNIKSSKISLKSKRNPNGITVSFPGFPYVGLWSKPTGAPFVCIEPWCGIADSYGHNGDLKLKEGIIKLEPDNEFKCTYTISVF